MAKVWPLQLYQTDKWVLMALADSANDEDDGKTWIPIVSKQPYTKRGDLKLSLTVKTRLSETTIRESIKRLVAAGHITRKENPGLGCTYWVHPVADETPAAAEGRRDARPPADVPPPAVADAPPRGSCGENQRNQIKPSAGARTRGARETQPSAGSLDEPATVASKGQTQSPQRLAEGEREMLVRHQIVVDAKREPKWLALGALRVCSLGDHIGGLGLNVIVPYGYRDQVMPLDNLLKQSCKAALGVPVAWVSVEVA